MAETNPPGWAVADDHPAPAGRRGRRLPAELVKLVSAGAAATADGSDGPWWKRPYATRDDAINARRRIAYALGRMHPAGELALRTTLTPAERGRWELAVQFYPPKLSDALSAAESA